MKKNEIFWVIDDDDIHQFFAKKSIEHLNNGNQVLPFLGGGEALKIFQQINTVDGELPDIILLDINMPGMDGWEFMDEFSKILPQITKKIAIFIVSSSIAEIDRERAKSYPAISGFLIKPISPNMIMQFFG